MRCEKLEPFDCGAEPNCCKRCTHKYQEHFNKDEHFPLLRQETNCWCGPAVSPASQQSICIVIFLLGMTKEPQLRLGFLVKRTFARIFTQEPEARRTSIEKSQRDLISESPTCMWWMRKRSSLQTKMKIA